MTDEPLKADTTLVTDKEIGARLKEARERAGLSIGQAARLRGSASHIIEQLESGIRSLLPQDIIAFCELYAVGYDWLLGQWHECDLPDHLVAMCEKLPPIDRRKLLATLASFGEMF